MHFSFWSDSSNDVHLRCLYYPFHSLSLFNYHTRVDVHTVAARRRLTRHAGPQQRLLVLAQALVILVQLLDLLQALLGRGFVVDGGVGVVDGRGQFRQLLLCRLLLCHFLLIRNRAGGSVAGARMVNNGDGVVRATDHFLFL